MEKFSIELRKIFNRLINHEQKAMIPLTDDEKSSYNSQKVCFLCDKKFCVDKNNKKDYKLYCKFRNHCHFTGKYRGAAHSKYNLKYEVPIFIPVVFHNGSTYDNHFVIKQLTKDFKAYFKCIGENTEKYISLSITTIKKSDKVSKRKNPDAYSLSFIDSFRFMNRSLSDLVNNLSEPNKNLSIDVLKQRFYNTYQLCQNNDEKF